MVRTDEVPRVLPRFTAGNNTYRVDMRLREFRWVSYEPPTIEFILFNSPEGRVLWDEWLRQRDR